jgi:hypothetical protein
VNRKPPELPDIEDATLRACLAPLMDAMIVGAEVASLVALPDAIARASRPARAQPPPTVSPSGGSGLSGSNDNPRPLQDAGAAREGGSTASPSTLGEWRSLADDDFGVFRMIELFLGMTDAELMTAAANFPKQIRGTLTRMARMKKRLAAQYDAVTIAMALLERAMARAADEPTPR